MYGFACFVKPGEQVQRFCRHAAAAPAQRLAGMQTIRLRPSSLLSLALPRGRMVQRRRTPFPSTAGGGGRVVADGPLNETGLTGSETNPAQHPDSLSTGYDETTWKSHGTITQQPSVVIRIVIFKQDANKERGSVSDVLIPARPPSHIVFLFTLSPHIWLEHAYISQCVLRCHCESDCNTTHYAIAVS